VALVVAGVKRVGARPPTPAPSRAPSGSASTPRQIASGPRGISLGIDTASVANNKQISWPDARSGIPIDFAIIRSNFSTKADEVFARDWPKIRAAGLVRGAYLFLRFPHPKNNMKAADPVSQANAMIRAVRTLDDSDLPPSLDVEFPGGRAATRMSAQNILAGVRAAWTVLRDHYGVAPIVYTSGRVWHEDLQDIEAPDLIESPLWLARYPYKKGPARRSGSDIAQLRNPPVPKPWGDATNWWIHQYQGDAVNLPGFPSGNVDMNRFNVTANGATGDRVRWIQRRLGVSETGTFDHTVEAAVRALQQRKGISPTGVIDVRTFAYVCRAR
jgi:GH25 family lysozyme M1 (1,4-beta-N-acetylmuramidase)